MLRFCVAFPSLFCSCSTDKHCTWYHALPHFKENMLNREEKMWFGLAAVFDKQFEKDQL